MNIKVGILISLIAILSLIGYFVIEKYWKSHVLIKTNFRDTSKFDLADVKTELSHFIANEFDRDFRKISYLNCNSEYCTASEEIFEELETSSYGNSTWRIDFYTSLYQITQEPKQKESALNRALNLTNEYLKAHSGKYSSQAYVFFNAYKRTGRLEFLRAFFIATQSLVKDSITGSVFSQKWINEDHPMSLVRYAEQIVLMSKLLSTELNTVMNIDFQNPPYPFLKEHRIRFDWIINSTDLIKLKSTEAADKFMSLAISASSRKIFHSQKVNRNDLNGNACWLAMGYASIWDITKNEEYRDKAYSTLNDAGLSEGVFENRGVDVTQSLIPCVNAYKQLSKSDNKMLQITKTAVVNLIETSWDGSKALLCSGKGGITQFSKKMVGFNKDIPQSTCPAHQFSIADNAWFFSTIHDMDNFNIYSGMEGY